MYFQNLDMVLAEPLRVSPLIKVRLLLHDNFVIHFCARPPDGVH